MKSEYFYNKLDELFRSGSIQEAENYIIRTMEQVQKENDLPALISLANELGGVFRVTGRLEEAQKVYHVALETIRLLKLEGTEQHGTTLMNLASVHSEGKQASKALDLYEQAAEIFTKKGLAQDYRMAALYNNLSHVYDLLGKADQALHCAEKSLAAVKTLSGQEVELATTYSTLAVRYLNLQEEAKAEEALKEAERIFISLPGKSNVHYAATLNAFGDLRFRQQRYADAVSFFEKALNIITENYGKKSSYAEVSQKNLEKARNLLLQKKASPDVSGLREQNHSLNMRMTGLGLSEAYFDEIGRAMIREQFFQYEKYMAVGLVGEGSECFGFDDEFSESHDFGPGFCIWLPDDIYRAVGAEIQEAYNRLPKTYRNQSRVTTAEGGGRLGVFSINDYYKKYIGAGDIPKDPVEWLFMPETSLATVTNGKVFVDHWGEFSRIRSGLLNFYPQDTLLKKLAARIAMMSQAGQYNYERCMKRGETAAAYLSCGEFIKNTISAVYLLNGSYMPFYKWMFRGMDKLEHLKEIKPMLEQLAAMPDIPQNTTTKADLIESVCMKVRDELKRQGLIFGNDAFLNNHCRDLMSRIEDPRIKGLPVMFDGK
ncbi:DUF4037 domain-containing protein [Anoxybacterium hadale]|uniref:DUF4037 domain-containing protein n=1 Tax=Anoxybacterium hadale TaxID=3408580 RepID=A0ACD1ACB2_9FIRM|nr:DUF4037 domain-containing protein [Clostridiales bacterium]